jgi:hypothetical protein
MARRAMVGMPEYSVGFDDIPIIIGQTAATS